MCEQNETNRHGERMKQKSWMDVTLVAFGESGERDSKRNTQHADDESDREDDCG